jgi:hypothetical protein
MRKKRNPRKRHGQMIKNAEDVPKQNIRTRPNSKGLNTPEKESRAKVPMISLERRGEGDDNPGKERKSTTRNHVVIRS